MPPTRKCPNSTKPSQTKRKAKVSRSCHACHSRKVACDRLSPACSACRRYARTLGNDPDSVVCTYGRSSEFADSDFAEHPQDVHDDGGSTDAVTAGCDEGADEERHSDDTHLAPIGTTIVNLETRSIGQIRSELSWSTPVLTPTMPVSTISLRPSFVDIPEHYKRSTTSIYSKLSSIIQNEDSPAPRANFASTSCFPPPSSDTPPRHFMFASGESAVWPTSNFDSFEDTPAYNFLPGLGVITPTLSATYAFGGSYF